MTRMSDKEFVELLKSCDAFIEYATATKKFADVAFYEQVKAALKAERQARDECERQYQQQVAQVAIEMSRAETAEAQLKTVIEYFTYEDRGRYRVGIRGDSDVTDDLNEILNADS